MMATNQYGGKSAYFASRAYRVSGVAKIIADILPLKNVVNGMTKANYRAQMV